MNEKEWGRRTRAAEAKARAGKLTAELWAARQLRHALERLKVRVQTVVLRSGVLDSGRLLVTRGEVDSLVRNLNRIFADFHDSTLALSAKAMERGALPQLQKAGAIEQAVRDLLPRSFFEKQPVLAQIPVGKEARELALDAIRGRLREVVSRNIAAGERIPSLSANLWRVNRTALSRVEALVNVGRNERWSAVQFSKALERVLVPVGGRATGPIWSARTTEKGLRDQLAAILGREPRDVVVTRSGGRISVSGGGATVKAAPSRLRGLVSGAAGGARSPISTVAYDYLRVVRTEMADVFRSADLKTNARLRDFGIKANMRWNLSASHAGIDQCDVLANANDYGLGAGVYPPAAFPQEPHPNGMCFSTQEMPSLSKVFRDLEARQSAAKREVAGALRGIGGVRA